MPDKKDLQQARASATADGDRRGLISFSGQSLAGSTHDLLRRHNLRPRKKLGQNFLLNEAKVRLIAAAASAAAQAAGAPLVIEIGPGLGALTVALAEQGLTVAAFEIDRSLQAPLAEVLAPYPAVTVHFQDFLQADLSAVTSGQPYVAAGNLPYQITAPILEKLFWDPHCRALIITVQKEVADRLRAAPGSSSYGPLTLFCAYHVQAVEVVTQLKPGDFLPPPQIASTALKLVKREAPPFAEPSAESFSRAVHAAFGHRRKSLRSGLALAPQLDLSREQVQAALDQAGIPGEVRAERLDLEQFARLARALDEVAKA